MTTRIGSNFLKIALASCILMAGAASAEQRPSTLYSSFDGEIVEVVESYGSAWNAEAYFQRSADSVTVALSEELRRMLAESRDASAEALVSR